MDGTVGKIVQTFTERKISNNQFKKIKVLELLETRAYSRSLIMREVDRVASCYTAQD